jgi:hypothetical protein
MTISATKILHSVTSTAVDIKTVLARYPRFIHAELMTHRVFSRNASSSRAIPVLRLLRDILRDPAMPIHWGKNQPGMQANEELGPVAKFLMRTLWLTGMYLMVAIAYLGHLLGVHKQVVNRLVEPWSHINVLITATEWENFFELRDHKDAQPEIKALAQAIKAAFADSVPDVLEYDDWHLPFITPDQKASRNAFTLDLIKMSVARCARTSYLTHDGTAPWPDRDIKLYDKLVGSRPLHASPAEHQVRSVYFVNDNDLGGNLGPGVVQYRKILERKMKEAA